MRPPSAAATRRPLVGRMRRVPRTTAGAPSVAAADWWVSRDPWRATRPGAGCSAAAARGRVSSRDARHWLAETKQPGRCGAKVLRPTVERWLAVPAGEARAVVVAVVTSRELRVAAGRWEAALAGEARAVAAVVTSRVELRVAAGRWEAAFAEAPLRMEVAAAGRLPVAEAVARRAATWRTAGSRPRQPVAPVRSRTKAAT